MIVKGDDDLSIKNKACQIVKNTLKITNQDSYSSKKAEYAGLVTIV
ncbi:MAG TPA: hypothetical protein VJS91_11520 [Nitrososphaeraceae archaeon]|nr:hypothetical protein [Nitrososphaeraceae archaeon]